MNQQKNKSIAVFILFSSLSICTSTFAADCQATLLKWGSNCSAQGIYMTDGSQRSFTSDPILANGSVSAIGSATFQCNVGQYKYVTGSCGGLTDSYSNSRVSSLPAATAAPTIGTSDQIMQATAGNSTTTQGVTQLTGNVSGWESQTQKDLASLTQVVSQNKVDATAYTDKAKSDAETYADSVSSKAYTNAVATASTDATNKANAAQSNAIASAKSYTDQSATNTLNQANSNAQAYANAAQSNAVASAKSYTDQSATNTLNQANSNAQGYANTAQSNSYAYTDSKIQQAKQYTDQQVTNSYNNAVATASTDATTKANNALSSANTYTDQAVANASTTQQSTGTTTPWYAGRLGQSQGGATITDDVNGKFTFSHNGTLGPFSITGDSTVIHNAYSEPVCNVNTNYQGYTQYYDIQVNGSSTGWSASSYASGGLSYAGGAGCLPGG